jgi:hypothetical protein
LKVKNAIVNRQSSIVNRQSSKCSLKTFTALSTAFVAASLLFGQTTLAASFSYEYNDTISGVTLPATLAIGDTVKITVTLDNGSSTRNSQTWTAAHLKAVTWNFKSGTLLTTFCTPVGGLDTANGNFVSDGSGALTAVMTGWFDGTVGTDFKTNSTGTPSAWNLVGQNSVYADTSTLIDLTNVANMLTAGNWVTSTLTPASCTVTAPVSAPVNLISTQQAKIFATEIKIK